MLPLILNIFLLSAQGPDNDVMYIGDQESKAIKIIKESAVADPALVYKTIKEWEPNFNGYSTLHGVYRKDIPILVAICFNNKILHLISPFPDLCGSNIEESKIKQFRDYFRSEKGKEIGITYMGDDTYNYTIKYPSSYVTIISAYSDNSRVTFMLNSYNIENLKIMRNKLLEYFKNLDKSAIISYI
jgi:hypothetical protein